MSEMQCMRTLCGSVRGSIQEMLDCCAANKIISRGGNGGNSECE